MAIKYLKQAIKTPSTDDHKTREAVQSILDDIEKRREEGIKEVTKKFDKYEGEIVVSKEKIEEASKKVDQKIKDDVPINPEKHGALSLFGKGLYFILAVVPLMIVSSHAWLFILNAFSIPIKPQDLVEQVQAMSFSWTLILLTLIAVVVVPLTEELLFRAFIYRSLKSYVPKTAAALISSLFFALMHYNVLSFVPLFILGFWLCRSYEDSGNIWVPITLHGLFNGNTILVLTLTR